MARRVQKDWYQILQVHPEADPETIQAAYRSLLRRCHPDKNPDRRAWAEQRTRELNEAYAVLSNAERRREFDALRARWGAGAFGTPRTIRTPGATAAGLGADAGYSLLFRENRRLEAQVARLQGEKAQLEAELVRTRTELQELQKRVEDLRRRLEESDGQRRRLEQALAVANKQRQLLQERLGSASVGPLRRRSLHPKPPHRLKADDLPFPATVLRSPSSGFPAGALRWAAPSGARTKAPSTPSSWTASG
ncbi:MAG: hypothetical protein KatS3mg115_1031 [Candidatus Poribacteria bacterium]|nr:MAG: hypothetical protein KatS3mg115_1031 [Candidatus Poribacteria bacterium]